MWGSRALPTSPCSTARSSAWAGCAGLRTPALGTNVAQRCAAWGRGAQLLRGLLGTERRRGCWRLLLAGSLPGPRGAAGLSPPGGDRQRGPGRSEARPWVGLSRTGGVWMGERWSPRLGEPSPTNQALMISKPGRAVPALPAGTANRGLRARGRWPGAALGAVS